MKCAWPSAPALLAVSILLPDAVLGTHRHSRLYVRVHACVCVHLCVCGIQLTLAQHRSEEVSTHCAVGNWSRTLSPQNVTPGSLLLTRSFTDNIHHRSARFVCPTYYILYHCRREAREIKCYLENLRKRRCIYGPCCIYCKNLMHQWMCVV